MRKQHYTAEIPVSNPYNIAAFEDLVSNIQAGYNEEKRLKNAAFEFMIDRGIYLEFHGSAARFPNTRSTAATSWGACACT